MLLQTGSCSSFNIFQSVLSGSIHFFELFPVILNLLLFQIQDNANKLFRCLIENHAAFCAMVMRIVRGTNADSAI